MKVERGLFGKRRQIKLVETLEKSSEYNQNMLTIYENEIGTLYIFKSHTN